MTIIGAVNKSSRRLRTSPSYGSQSLDHSPPWSNFINRKTGEVTSRRGNTSCLGDENVGCQTKIRSTGCRKDKGTPFMRHETSLLYHYNSFSSLRRRLFDESIKGLTQYPCRIRVWVFRESTRSLSLQDPLPSQSVYKVQTQCQ